MNVIESLFGRNGRLRRNILLLWRRQSELTHEEASILSNFLGDLALFRFMASCPGTSGVHALSCDQNKPVLVLMPQDGGLPMDVALKSGYRHVTLMNGKLMELVELRPVYREFVP